MINKLSIEEEISRIGGHFNDDFRWRNSC
jgi:hypothetical protein